MHFCLIYNLNSSSGKKVKLVNKIYEKKKKKQHNSIDYYKTKSEKESEKKNFWNLKIKIMID